ncbi:DUF933 domain-containing protein [Hamiltosporidium tvaerminnensis]|uniref:DUF933 domain-containing protein n=1 Tax=Hamiltosporidium tvaerminnensis TaxID=1176355 RepID=A0A4Q9KW65_9MICR|nr:DUF933 domain-containing protein [Hamiltosporidium tvaerminnensis]
MVRMGCSVLDLITYFTVGKDEVRSWKIRNKTLLPQAGGVIHTDFEKYFVAAEEEGKVYTKGKMYVVEDGDIIHFKFNAPKGGGGSKKDVWCVNDTNY